MDSLPRAGADSDKKVSGRREVRKEKDEKELTVLALGQVGGRDTVRGESWRTKPPVQD